MTTATTPDRTLPAGFIILSVTALAAMLLVWLGFIPTVFPYDDSYIVAYNAGLIAAGQQDVAYDTAALTGSSSVAHVALASSFALFTTPLKALMMTAILGLWFYAMAAWYASIKAGLGRLAPLGLLLFLLPGITPIQLVNGLDTGLAMATSLWLLCLALNRSTASALAIALLTGLAPHIRSELMALALPVFLLAAYDHRSRKIKGIPVIVFMLAIAALGFIPFSYWVFANTGHWSPLTWQAKAAFYAESCRPLFKKSAFSAKQFLILLLINMPMAIGLLVPAKNRLYALVIFFTAAFFLAYGLYMPSALAQKFVIGRYTSLLLPGWVMCFLFLIGREHKEAKSLLVGACLIHVLTCYEFMAPQITTLYREHPAILEDVADWANRNIPEGSSVLLHDAGYFAYGTGQRFHLTDLIGLKTPWAIPIHQAVTVASCGSQRADAIAEIAEKAHIQWAILNKAWYFDTIEQGLKKAGYQMDLRYQTSSVVIYALHKD